MQGSVFRRYQPVECTEIYLKFILPGGSYLFYGLMCEILKIEMFGHVLLSSLAYSLEKKFKLNIFK